MQTTGLFLIILLTFALQPQLTIATQSPTAPMSYPPVVIENSQARVLKSERTGQSYAIQVLLPPNYAGSDKTYPVFYTLDGQWDFKLMAGMIGGLAAEGLIPMPIVVGITYATEPENSEKWRFDHFVLEKDSPVGADRFLAFFKDELIPFIETQYRAQPDDRVLLGGSLAGFFSVYALFHEPNLFQRHVSASPSLWWGEEAAFAYEAAFAAAHTDLPASLSLTVGAMENPDSMIEPIQRLADLLEKRGYPGLTLHSQVIARAHHSSIKPLAYTLGLQALYEKKAIEVAPDILARYVGSYHAVLNDGEEFTFAITLQEGQLYAQSKYENAPNPVHALSLVRFFSRMFPLEFTFNINTEGRAHSLTFHEHDEDWSLNKVN